MPTQCSAIGCSNRFEPAAKKRGLSFHKVPQDPERREEWKRALRRDFQITKYTVICSDHFQEQDLDRTGQTNRLREGVTPSIFNFPDKPPEPDPDPDQPRRSRRNRKKTKKGDVYKSAVKKVKSKYGRKIYLPEESLPAKKIVQKARKSIRPTARGQKERQEAPQRPREPPPPAPAAIAASVDDHHYAIDPGSVKQKLDEAYARIEELQKELRSCKDRLRRKESEFQTLSEDIEKQNALMSELMEGSELWVLCNNCIRKD